MALFEKDADYEAFERVLAEAMQEFPTRLLSYCLMPNHWHLVIWPRNDGELTDFLRWLTHTHVMRWHAHYGTSGTGHLYQGRFKAFPMETDEHFYTVLRYGVEYQKRSEEEFTAEHRKRMEKNLHRRAKELGYEWKKIEVPAEEEASVVVVESSSP